MVGCFGNASTARDKKRRGKWYYERLAAAFTTRVRRIMALTPTSAFKAGMKRVFSQKEILA